MSLRDWIPLAVLAAGCLGGFYRLDARVQLQEQKLEQHDRQLQAQKAIESAVADMRVRIERIDANVENLTKRQER